MEQWKDAKGFDGIIRISNQGRVWNVKKGKEMIPYDNGCGYKKISIRLNGKDFKPYIHRLVANAFIPNPENLPEVNHIDSNPANNAVTNLEWVDSSGNTIHALQKKRLIPWGNAPKAIVAEKDGASLYFETISRAERFFNSRHISNVLKGERKHVKGWSFKYAEGGDENVNRPWKTEQEAGSFSA